MEKVTKYVIYYRTAKDDVNDIEVKGDDLSIHLSADCATALIYDVTEGQAVSKGAVTGGVLPGSLTGATVVAVIPLAGVKSIIASESIVMVN